jgi:lipopolysaccharide export system permease protein
MLPSMLMLILPRALFVAVVFTYHKYKSDSELTVMEAAGLSRLKLAAPALLVAFGVAVAGYVISLYLLPVSYGQFRDMQSFLRNNYVSVLLQEGVFNTPVEGLTVFIRERDSDGTLKGLLVHDNRQPDMAVTMMAEEGRLAETPQGQRFLLTHGNRQEMRGGKLSFLNFDHYALDISLYTQDMTQRPKDPQEEFVQDLLRNGGDIPPERVRQRLGEAHQRLIWPAYAFTLTLLALAVLLSGQFNRRGQAKRIGIAVLLASAIAFGAIGLRNTIGEGVLFVALAYGNLVLPALLSLYILSDRVPVPAARGRA